MSIAIEKVKALRYKLCMMGVPIEGPASVFADNESVVKSSEAFVANTVNIFFISLRENLADLLTKVLSINVHQNLFKCIFW